MDGGPVKLIRSAAVFYESLFSSLRGAEKSVRIQIYLIEEGSIAEEFKSILIGLAKKGVKVELIYDSAGCVNVLSGYFDDMEEEGVGVMEYHPVNPTRASSPFSVRKLLRRNHRKVFIIDSDKYYIGGINIGERFLEWEDVAVYGEGWPAQELCESFERTWSGKKRTLLKPPGKPEASLGNRLQVWDGRPALGNYPIKRLYVSAIKKSKHRVWIAQAYFIPRRKLLKAIIHAAKRGVDTRVVVPDFSDVATADAAAWIALTRLLKHGVKVYRFEPAMLHSKMAMIDSDWVTVGTANLDSMSLYWNLEVNFVARGGILAKDAEDVFDSYFERSRQITLEEAEARPVTLKMAGWFLNYFAWIL
jgi:cardiolipin synthase